MDARKKEELKKALIAAKVGEVLVDEFIGDLLNRTACDEGCYAGCSKCCSSGSANRFSESANA